LCNVPVSAPAVASKGVIDTIVDAEVEPEVAAATDDDAKLQLNTNVKEAEEPDKVRVDGTASRSKRTKKTTSILDGRV
jgi:hypothetical protein